MVQANPIAQIFECQINPSISDRPDPSFREQNGFHGARTHSKHPAKKFHLYLFKEFEALVFNVQTNLASGGQVRIYASHIKSPQVPCQQTANEAI
jgi:hypothetical protein